MLIHLLLLVGMAHSYIASEQVQIKPDQLLKEIRTKNINLTSSQDETTIKADLKTGKVQLDAYMPEPQLVGLKKEINANEKNLDTAKLLAKYLLYKAVENRWAYDLEYTILNDIGASNFSQFAPSLLDTLQNQTRYMGSATQNGKVFLRFQIADWGFVSVERELKEAKLNIEFDSNADNNHIPDSVKKLKSIE